MVLSACSTTEAPVVNGWKQNTGDASNYSAQEGDTLYSVAWAFGVDYRQLASYNHLQEPYNLHADQVVRMTPSPAAAPDTTPITTSAAPVITPLTAPPAPAASTAVPPKTTATRQSKPAQTLQRASPTPTSPSLSPVVVAGGWRWPTKGVVARNFSTAAEGNRGIDISGKLDQPVVAANDGKVVYTGASLPGYGNLIIIKHNDNELSAYAFNKVLMVKEGQVVRAGQPIARMGKNDNGKPMLHFEIRKQGKPVNPLPYFKSLRNTHQLEIHRV